MNLAEMRARLAEIESRFGEIDTEAGDEALAEERQTEWDGLETEHGQLKDAIRRAEARQERVRSLADRGATDKPAAPAYIKTRTDAEIYDTSSLRSEARSEEHYGDLLRDNAMRAVERARFSGTAKRSEAQDHVAHLLDNVDNYDSVDGMPARSLARRLLHTGSPDYERAFSKVLRAMGTTTLTPEEARAMSLGTDSAGGYAVPFQLDPSVILTNNGALNPLRQIARVEQIVGKKWQGVTSAGITVSRDAEASEVSDDSPTLAQPEVKAERVAGFVPFSIEIDMDWTQFRSEVSRMLADARDREEATAFVTGTGTPPDANGVVATLSGNTVSTITNDTFAAGDVYKLEENLAPRWRNASASFLAHRAIYNKIRQFDTAGGAQMWERIGAGLPSQLLGYNAYETSAMASTVADAAKIVLFGDFSNFLIVDRVGMTVELVPHLFATANNLPSGSRGIYAIWRNNSKILVDAAFKLLVVQ